MIVETEAVVLRAMKYRDTSKIVTLYSRRYGKIKIVAKGTRNQKTNKFGSSLEPMTHSSIVLYKKEHHDLHLLSKSEIVTPLKRLQEDSEKMYSGLALIELVNMVMHDEEENEPMFELLVNALRVIDGAAKNSINVLLTFMIQLFHHFGFGLDVESCTTCHRNTGEHHFRFGMLRLSDGKFNCSECSEEKQQSGIKLSGGMVKSLYFLHRSTIEKSVQITLTTPMRDDLLALLQSYLQYHIDSVRTLRSLTMLQSIGTSQR